MYKIVNAEQMRRLDEITINETGISGLVLMENAGRSVVDFIFEIWANDIYSPDKSITVICGKGNNGGDGLVIARHLINNNIKTEIILLSDETALKGDALSNFLVLKNMNVKYYTVTSESSFNDKIKTLLSKSFIIIDSIFGTGFKGKITGFISNLISYINNLNNIRKISVDVPSGVESNSNAVPEIFFKPDYTVTFGLPKLAFVLDPVCHYVGKLIIKDISFPQSNVAVIDSNIFLLDYDDISTFIPYKKPYYHKGEAGKVLVIGGSKGMTGAACLTATASIKSGAGLVTVACPSSLNSIFEVKLTECMSLPLSDDNGFITEDSFDSVKKFAENVDVVAFGPGIGRNPKTTKLLNLMLKELSVPLIIDADGLFHLACKENMDIISTYKNRIIITPHIVEFSRLLNISKADILSNKFNVLKEFSRKYNVITVLKGKFTSISFPGKNIFVINAGNELLATGGSGDVLTGMIAGFTALGTAFHNNAVAAVFRHSQIADYLKTFNKNIVASDIINYI